MKLILLLSFVLNDIVDIYHCFRGVGMGKVYVYISIDSCIIDLFEEQNYFQNIISNIFDEFNSEIKHSGLEAVPLFEKNIYECTINAEMCELKHPEYYVAYEVNKPSIPLYATATSIGGNRFNFVYCPNKLSGDIYATHKYSECSSKTAFLYGDIDVLYSTVKTALKHHLFQMNLDNNNYQKACSVVNECLNNDRFEIYGKYIHPEITRGHCPLGD